MVKKDKIIIVSCCVIIMLLVVDLLIINLSVKELSAKDIFNKNALSVVEVKAETEEVGESFGTGEFIKNDGTIVTNAHVVTYKQAGDTTTFENYFIRFIDSDDYLPVTLVKFDVNLDLAILKYTTSEHQFSAVKIGDSKKVETGDKVFAIGNAMNYGLAISSGIISIPLLNLTYDGVTRKVIQCDLTIAEGNSGGALFDRNGKIIGITTFRTKDNAGQVVYGFAYCVPISIVVEYVENWNYKLKSKKKLWIL